MKTLIALTSLCLVATLSGCGGHAEHYTGKFKRISTGSDGSSNLTITEGHTMWVIRSETSMEVMLNEAITLFYERVPGSPTDFSLGTMLAYDERNAASEAQAANDPDSELRLDFRAGKAQLVNGLLDFQVSADRSSTSPTTGDTVRAGTLDFSFSGFKR